MSKLQALQDHFQKYLLHQDHQIEKQIVGTETVSAGQRLNIYADAYCLRLIEALDVDYPALHILLGDQQFDELCRAYIRAYPSKFRSARWFGKHLTTFIKETAPYSQQPLLEEMAQFEWTLSEVFDAQDCVCVDEEKIKSVAVDAWPEMQFILNPSLKLLYLKWNVVSIWKAVIQEEKTPEASSELKNPVNWIVWRHDLETQFCSLQEDEVCAINAMRKDKTFAEICEGLCEWVDPENAAMHAATLLKRWIKDGLIARVSWGQV